MTSPARVCHLPLRPCGCAQPAARACNVRFACCRRPVMTRGMTSGPCASGRREEERLTTRKLGTRLQHRMPLPLKIPIPAVDFRDLANAPRGTAPQKPAHAPTPHPAASGNSILAGSPVNHPAGGEHMELSFEVAHVPSPGISLQPARFVGHQISAKFGRGWGKYNPVHVPICDVEDVEAELAKPNFGCKRLLCASKADIAKLNDRRRSAAQPICAARTLVHPGRTRGQVRPNKVNHISYNNIPFTIRTAEPWQSAMRLAPCTRRSPTAPTTLMVLAIRRRLTPGGHGLAGWNVRVYS